MLKRIHRWIMSATWLDPQPDVPDDDMDRGFDFPWKDRQAV